MSYLCLVCDAPVEQDPDTIDLRWRHERPGAFGHGAQPDFDRIVEAEEAGKRNEIRTVHQARIILQHVTTPLVLQGLPDAWAINAAQTIANAVDLARSLPHA